jgi:bacteriocin biosynthesis cyclodehydratase domain-containing protein
MIKGNLKDKRFIYLRPGANVFKQANDNLQIAFPNYTVNFQTPDIVSLILEILSIMNDQHNVENIIESVTKKIEVDNEFAEYIINQLVSNNCAFFTNQEWIEKDENELTRFYKYIIEKSDIVEKLQKTKFILLTPEDKIEDCKSVFKNCGLNPLIIPAINGRTIKDYKEDISKNITADIEFIASWNFPFRQPTANMINNLCINIKIPVLFGGCEGIISRIGPYVIPLNSSCLECMHLRLNSNFDENEIRSYAKFRVIEENNLGISWVSHPSFHLASLHLFAIEINRISIGLTSNCLGSFYEYFFGQMNTHKHLVIKVPNCPVCSSGKPARFAWDFQFPAPVVKNNI